MRVITRPALAALVVAGVLAGAGTAAARFDPFGDRRQNGRTSLLSELAHLDALDVLVVDDAASVAAETGLVVPEIGDLPPGVTGEPRYLVAGPGFAAVWRRPTGVPGLIVARAVVPQELAAEPLSSSIASLTRDHVTTTPAEIHGTSATVLTTRDRSLSGVVWAVDGVTNLVAGPLDTADVLAVARSLP